MFLKNLQFALRNFRKNKVTSAIHVIGLAVGISASVVIFLIIRYDYSFDKWEPQREHIYRVYTQFPDGNGNYGISMLAPHAIKENVTGIRVMAHFLSDLFYDATVRTGKDLDGKSIVFPNVQGIVAADDNYFKIFPHKWLAGDAASLRKLNTVVLSLGMAEKFFPHQSPASLIGQPLVFQDTINAIITGIVEDIGAHTDFDNRIFISLNTITQTSLLNSVVSTPHWTNVDGRSQCLVLLQPNVVPQSVNAQIRNLYSRHQKETDPENIQTGQLQPLSDIHFNTALDGKVSKSSLRNLGLLAVLLLLLAAINFINLSTAQSTLRGREMGVRKTFGGSNRQIIYQFLSETLVITLCAAILAFLLVPLLLHAFEGFIPQGLNLKAMLHPSILGFLAAMVLTVTLAAGLYPAVVLTKFRPAAVLKSRSSGNGRNKSVRVREVLIIAQFVLAQVFLIVVFVISKQIHYELNKNIGIRKTAVVSIFIPDYGLRHHSRGHVLVNTLKNIPQIENLTLCTKAPVAGGWSSTAINWLNKGDNKVFDNVHVRSGDENYVSVFGLQLAGGENLQMDTSDVVTDVLINESLLHLMGLQHPDEAIGQIVSGGPSDSARIVGVLKDFTTMSLHHPIYPTVVFAGNSGFAPTLSIALAGSTPMAWKSTLDKVEQLFRELYPYKAFEATFLDETIRNLYRSDIRLSTLLRWTTGLAVFISCLGLLGLVSFMANQRIKEIGIRKVLGATVVQIIHMLSKSLFRLILIASVIAFPIGWYFAHKWLQDFAFKTTLSWWIFCVSGLGMLSMALLVLCLRTYKLARENPLHSLKEQ